MAKSSPYPLTYRLDFLAAAGTLVLIATFIAFIPMLMAGESPSILGVALGKPAGVSLLPSDGSAAMHVGAPLNPAGGTLVYNPRNYPILTELFRELGVATQDSEMSFSVSCPCGLEYSGRRPFAQPRRTLDPRRGLDRFGTLVLPGLGILLAVAPAPQADAATSDPAHMDKGARRPAAWPPAHRSLPLTRFCRAAPSGRATSGATTWSSPGRVPGLESAYRWCSFQGDWPQSA